MEMTLVADEFLLSSLKEGFQRERTEQVLFLKRLAEVDRRGLWKKTACSLNEFCRKELGLSESSAWKRIQVCHLGTKIPLALKLLEENKITLTNLSILSPCLTLENAESILGEASGLGRYAVEAIKARFLPKPEPRDSITPLSAPAPVIPPSPVPSPAKAEPEKQTESAQEPTKPATRVRISFVADETLVNAINKVKALLSHKYPNARLEDIEAEVYRFYLEAHDPEKKKAKPRNQTSPNHTRYTPVSTKTEVWKRDEGQCTYRYENGERCSSTYALELDHNIPFCQGGRSDRKENRRLLCRHHNQMEAERVLGKNRMEKLRKKNLPIADPNPFRYIPRTLDVQRSLTP